MIVTHLAKHGTSSEPVCGAPGPVRPVVPKGKGTVLCDDCRRIALATTRAPSRS